MQVAIDAGLSESYVTRVETGKSRGTPESLSRIAAALQLSMEKLFSSRSNLRDAPPDIGMVPLLDKVQAGRWKTVQYQLSEAEFREMVPVNYACPPSTFAQVIEGNSMTPEYQPGDLVIIDPTIAPRPGDCVVAIDPDGDAVFKKYRDVGVNEQGQRVFELVSLNPDYAPMRSDRVPISIVGTMREHRRFRKMNL